MAIIEMKKLNLIGLKAQRGMIMNILSRSRQFEVVPTTALEGCKRENASNLDKLLARCARLDFVIEFFESTKRELTEKLALNVKQVKKGRSEPMSLEIKPTKKVIGRHIITSEDISDISAKEYELMAIVDQLEKISISMMEQRSFISKLETQIRSLAPLKCSTIKFSDCADSKYTSVILASGTTKKLDLTKLTSLENVVIEHNFILDEHTVTAVCLKEMKDEIKSELSALGLVTTNNLENKTAQEVIDELNARKLEHTNKLFELSASVLDYEKYLIELKVIYDYFSSEAEKSTAEANFFNTQKVFVLEGWLPADVAEVIIDEIRSKSDQVFVTMTDVAEGDTPPTLVRSKAVFRPYEDITNMYATPSYHEVDPNPFVAIFFFIIFGFMVADAGYGLIMTVICTLAVFKLKLEQGMKRLVMVIGMGGISTIIWGVMFGGMLSTPIMPALWFNPMEEPIMMLVVAIAIGIIQLLTGYTIKAYSLIKKKQVWSAVFDIGSIYLLFAGIFVMIVAAFVPNADPITMNIGLGLLVASLALIVLTAGRKNKGIVSKIMGGFAGLYGLVNLLSDVLSYARLFGLGLASGAIGMAFNTLGVMIFAIPIIGYPVGFALLVVLHSFNLGIGLLGAYVHNSRLQYLEFFGKFYEGEGRLFAPMGVKSKFTRVEFSK